MYRESLNSTRYNPLNVVKTKTVFNMPLKLKQTVSNVWDGPPLIFTSSLTDFFHEECDPFRKDAWDTIRKCPHLTFQILTKRPERITDNLPSDWGTGWKNVWLGTSVGHQNARIRIAHLLKVVSKTRFISLEPLHGPIALGDYLLTDCYCSVWPYVNGFADKGNPIFDADCLVHDISGQVGIDWVIVGGESGNENGKYRYRECKIEWIESIVDQCKKAGVPVFVKQLGTHLSKKMGLKDRHGGDINEWPEHLRIRQFPV
jgi:protein gp37